MTDVPAITMNNGVTIPQLGLGVYKVSDGDAYGVVSTALQAGYRHVDTAAMYGNERGVGRALADSGIPRDELFVTTKLNNPDQGYDETLRAFDASMDRLGLDVVDLYLIHWPLPRRDRYIHTWRGFEKIYADGRARAIGVSNFHIHHLRRLFAETGVRPALNQVELSPYLVQRDLREFHAAHGIVTESWSPLARGGALLADPLLVALGVKYGKSPAQIVIRWHLQNGLVVIPKSVTPSRIVENIDVFDFELDADDVTAVSELDRGERTGADPDHLN